LATAAGVRGRYLLQLDTVVGRGETKTVAS